MSEQVPFDASEFADNPEPRCPCLLLLDTSLSMSGPKIEALNAGLHVLKTELSTDGLAAKRVELATVTFGGDVVLLHDFQGILDYEAKPLATQGDTPMGAAIEQAIDLIQLRKQTYRANGILYYRPWIFLLTDGEPTDGDRWRSAAARVQEGEKNQKFSFFTVAVPGAEMSVLEKISVRQPLWLEGLMFREMFLWLSCSLKSRSQRNPGEIGDEHQLEAPRGWARA